MVESETGEIIRFLLVTNINDIHNIICESMQLQKENDGEIKDLIKESLQLSFNLLSLVTIDKAIENHIRRITFFKSFFAQIVYEFDLPADFVRGIHEVDNFLSNKINELERRFDMIGT